MIETMPHRCSVGEYRIPGHGAAFGDQNVENFIRFGHFRRGRVQKVADSELHLRHPNRRQLAESCYLGLLRLRIRCGSLWSPISGVSGRTPYGSWPLNSGLAHRRTMGGHVPNDDEVHAGDGVTQSCRARNATRATIWLGNRCPRHGCYVYFSLVGARFSLEQQLGTSAPGSLFDLDTSALPALTLFAIEEPENHLAPHYLSRILALLTRLAKNAKAQVLLSSQSPSVLGRVDPERVRHLQMNAQIGSPTSTISRFTDHCKRRPPRCGHRASGRKTSGCRTRRRSLMSSWAAWNHVLFPIRGSSLRVCFITHPN